MVIATTCCTDGWMDGWIHINGASSSPQSLSVSESNGSHPERTLPDPLSLLTMSLLEYCSIRLNTGCCCLHNQWPARNSVHFHLLCGCLDLGFKLLLSRERDHLRSQSKKTLAAEFGSLAFIERVLIIGFQLLDKTMHLCRWFCFCFTPWHVAIESSVVKDILTLFLMHNSLSLPPSQVLLPPPLYREYC